jgi:hypothetical protein
VVCPRWRQGGRRWRLNSGGVDQGLDCFFFSWSRVLCVFSQDYVVISITYRGPDCNLYPPILI